MQFGVLLHLHMCIFIVETPASVKDDNFIRSSNDIRQPTRLAFKLLLSRNQQCNNQAG